MQIHSDSKLCQIYAIIYEIYSNFAKDLLSCCHQFKDILFNSGSKIRIFENIISSYKVNMKLLRP